MPSGVRGARPRPNSNRRKWRTARRRDDMATFLTKKHLSRRTFLRGSGVAVGLPFLDAMVPAGTAFAKNASMAITLDQVIAQKLGQGTALPSLEVSSETTIQVAACGGAGCYYASTTSYSGPNTPLPMEYNPRKVFIQLMGEGDTAAER